MQWRLMKVQIVAIHCRFINLSPRESCFRITFAVKITAQISRLHIFKWLQKSIFPPESQETVRAYAFRT